MLGSSLPISLWPKSKLLTVAPSGKQHIVSASPGLFFYFLLLITPPALQLTYPGTRISTLRELFDFAECADPSHQIQWNIESKVNPHFSNQTRGPLDFAVKQYEVFSQSSYLRSITVCFPIC